MRKEVETCKSYALRTSFLAVCGVMMGCANLSASDAAGYGGETNNFPQGGATGVAGNGQHAGGAGAGQAPKGRASMGTTGLPCDVKEALGVCRTCHAASPLAGVPMALVTWEDFQAGSVSNGSIPVYKMVDTRIHDAARPMPPATEGSIPPTSKGIIEKWLTAGAPKNTDPSCTSQPPPPPPPPGDAGSGHRPPPPPVDAGKPPDQGECYQFLAHGQSKSKDTSPFAISSEQYVAFDFDAPWAADAQGISFRPIFDDHPEIVHHWLLYLASGGIFPFPMADGTVEPNQNGSHPGATLIAGWAPGGNNGVNLPPNVGMDINGTSRKVVLEIHYYTNGGSFQSRSGMEVCVTKTPRPNIATVSWLGTESISLPAGKTSTVSGVCAPSTPQDIHILRTWPHMHKIGTHMLTKVNHKAGGTENLVDKDFNFSSQVSYDSSILLKQGDTLTTTCTYNNNTNGTVGYGTKTTQEMCFNFVTAWPAGLLTHGTAMNGSLNPCMN